MLQGAGALAPSGRVPTGWPSVRRASRGGAVGELRAAGESGRGARPIAPLFDGGSFEFVPLQAKVTGIVLAAKQHDNNKWLMANKLSLLTHTTLCSEQTNSGFSIAR